MQTIIMELAEVEVGTAEEPAERLELVVDHHTSKDWMMESQK